VRHAAVRHAAKALASASDLVRTVPDGVVVLLYHRVGGSSGLEMDLSVDRFERQIAWLASQHRPTALDTAMDELAVAERSGAWPDSPPIVVTFDDGTADFVDAALPILVRHHVPATLYVATHFVQRGVAFPDGGRSATWQGLRDALTTDLVTIGSHTHHHLLLDRVPPDVVDDELNRSIDLIGEHLGVTADHFAYPKAVPGSPHADREVRRQFRTAALGGNRPNAPGRTDPHRLRRSPIQASDGMRWFVRKAGGGMALEEELRQRINRRRYAGVTT
jgi:peptidoglycan/xylan/chitin deacetylase (PgdA/CDA1 family)